MAYSISPVSFAEAPGGNRVVTITVTRSEKDASQTVAFLTTKEITDPINDLAKMYGLPEGPSATASRDDFASYSKFGYPVSFAKGQLTATFKLTITGNDGNEGSENFFVSFLQSPLNLISATIVEATFAVSSGGGNGSGAGGQYIPGAFYGTEAADLITAQGPNAVLVGNGGNDTFLVNGFGDTIIEVANGGTDIVYTTASYALGNAQVEALSTAQQTDTTAINLIGNFVSQTIVGNYGNNILNGGGGQDTLIGLFGDDTYAIGDSRTVIQEQAGQGNDTLVTSVDYRLGTGVSIETFAAQDASSTTGLRLIGNELAQTIAGTAGADTIGGGGGRDVLMGGAGADTFLIGTVAIGNVAVLADFVGGTDRIGLTSTAFNIGTGLDAAEFVAGTVATTADQRVIYNAGTGQLFYDADGNGAGAAVLFAQVMPGTAITAASFDVIVPTATAA